MKPILQYTGPNGVFICPFCLAQLADLKMGVPHAPLSLPKYSDKDPRLAEEKTFQQRTLEGMATMADNFASSGLPKSQVSKFQNCEAKPLISPEGPVIDHISVMPLHLSLGLGLQLVNVAEDIATAMDLKIREDNGSSSSAVITVMAELESLALELAQLEENLNDLIATTEE